MKRISTIVIGLFAAVASQAAAIGDDSPATRAPDQTASVAAPDSKPAGDAKDSDDNCLSSVLSRDTLTNDWFGLGEKLSESGFALSLGLTQIYQQNLRGGMSTHRRAGRYSGRYDLEMEADLDTLLGWSGGRAFLGLARGGWSDGIDESSVGSLFGANAVAVGDRSIDVWQLYFEQSFANDKANIRIGKVDLTGCYECRGCPGSFDGNSFANDEATQFLNGSLVNNPTIPFPDPGLGIVVHVEPAEWWYVSAAVADADADVRETGFRTAFHGPDNFFSILETGFLPQLPSTNGPLQGAYRIGMWYDPQPKDRFNGSGTKRDDVGFYLSVDQVVCKENADADDSQGLGLFARYGVADSSVNEVKSFWSVGGQYQGLIPTRDDDVLGVGVGQGSLSGSAGFSASHETAVEAYYSIQITPWLNVTPSVQYIANPGGDRDVDDAVVGGIRLQISF